MKLSTYLTYDGNAREAFTFYQQVLGGTLELMTFAQAPDAEQFPAEYRERIMHACLNLGDSTLMASRHAARRHLWRRTVRRHQGLLDFPAPDPRGRGRAAVRCPGRRRYGDHAAGEDLLGRAFRHADRPLRSVLDGQLRVTPASPRAAVAPEAAQRRAGRTGVWMHSTFVITYRTLSGAAVVWP